MNRQIKFRAWDKTTKSMSPVKALDWQTNSADKRVVRGSVSQILTKQAVSVFDSHYSKPIWEIELMQFTGLYDVNGKEIYEGDIIKHRYFSIKGVAEVRWSDDEACFLAIEPNGARVILRPNSEIIGNVWEHPQLLNENK